MDDPSSSKKSPLSIDLNEPPPSPPHHPNPSPSPDPSSYSLVLKFLRMLAPTAEGAAAVHPGEAGVGGTRKCGICEKPEVWGGTVVCDGCETGFHLGCLRLGQRQKAVGGDWVCGECALSGPTQKRWVVGPVRLLDINEPPSPGEEEIGRMTNHDEAFSNGVIDEQHSCLNIVQMGNAFDLAKHTGIAIDTVQKSSEAIQQHGLSIGRGFEDLVLGSSVRGRPVLSRATRSGQSNEELLLNTLRSFIFEKGGFLGEGWHVEFIQSSHGYNPNPIALYCAPDGKKFESMHDVAYYLGISSSFTPVEIDERSDGCGTVQRPLSSRRRKKDLARISATSKSAEKQDNARINCREELCSDTEFLPQYYDIKCASRTDKSYMEENGVNKSHNLSIGLPLQYEDFFVLCLGKIDVRGAYHDSHQIWPIGYRSNWHDKITGSLFQCEVADGGDSGPVFKVKRCPCSSSPIPNGETILLNNKAKKMDTALTTECNSMIFDASFNEEEDILMLLSDPNPSDQEFLSCLGQDNAGQSYGSSLRMDMQKQESLRTNLERSMDPSGEGSSLKDEIGEFYVEGRSSSSVWKMVSRTLIDACHEVYRQSGCLQFCCRHESTSSCSYGEALKDVQDIGSLARFYCAYGPIETPRVIRNDIELEASFGSLTKWLEHDRFGLDVGFVQEIIETLPSSRACSQYQFLIDRSGFSGSCTVGSGLLLAIRKNEGGGGEEISYGLYSAKNGSRLPDLPQGFSFADVRPPPGRPLSSKLPAELVGDVFPIWEFLWRFYEILGLKEPSSFEELEQELIDPWPCDLNHLKIIEKENQDILAATSLGTESANCSVSLSSGVSGSTTLGQNLFKLIPVETAVTKEATQVIVASRTYGSCCGVALTKAHVSLLKVLVGELRNKVAVFLDPNFDARDSKSRRGRKKDIENPSPIKESKSELLTVNELTWPELARRYVLAVLSMNGRMEDVTGRESLKVFRCLQGDGGVLCGSLSGIAGMEADALLLAEAERQISDSTKQENDVMPVDYNDSDAACSSEPVVITSNSLPEWAQPLQPVRKLPTNVGTRIRKCVYTSLEKNPPEWAKDILEHSVSKEVYKGNASGPTKKAVLSVLAKLSSGSQQQKTDKPRIEKRPLSISEAIMKKCRCVLRSAVSADESKKFCNLLGTTLLTSSDNNDKGILGSPAMVSRPLDFRTIDLRLALGAYGGSHETFLEDVREVWHNLRAAYGDQPDLMQKLERLLEDFEYLYEKEVLQLYQKFANHSGTERFDPEIQKELNDILLGGNELPKAPWEDGVCKVCGIDKDDTSVLLCDKCDSEYHRYCLNPPLARIPDGDWFCPSCISDHHKMQNDSKCTQSVTSYPTRHLGDESRAFQEALNQLASSIEVKEYWEFNTEERIFLLRFLCDEMLNSALLRDHLEHCVDKSSNAQQKLYALTIDWRNLKFKEELLTRSLTEHTDKSSGNIDFLREGGTAMINAHQGRFPEQRQHFSNKMIYTTGFSESPLRRTSSSLVEFHEENGQTDASHNFCQLLKSMIEKHVNSKKPAAERGTHTFNGHVLNTTTINENPFSIINVGNCNELNGKEQSAFFPQNGSEAVEELVHDADADADAGNIQRGLIGVLNYTNNLDENILSVEGNGIVQSNADAPRGIHTFVDYGRTPSLQNTVLHGNQSDVPTNLTEFEADNLEANSISNEISNLQDSITSLESQVLFTSLRRDFLGRDSIGRLYWVIGRPGKRPWLVVGGSITVPWERTKTSEIRATKSGRTCGLASNSSFVEENVPPSYNQSDCNTMWNSSPLVLYESDAEIQQLVSWLKDADPKERELKECILQWQKLGFYQENIYASIDLNPISSAAEQLGASHRLLTKAAALLEKKYGPCMEMEACEIPKKRGRRAKANNEERMYRCECLEPVWPSRHHCLSCHQTFFFVIDLDGHNDGRCAPTIPIADESKENDDQVRGKGVKSDNTKGKERSDDVDIVEISKLGKLDISSTLVKFPKKTCPYDLEEICKTFTTIDSNKELVKEVGLFGSNGVPPLMSSPPMFFDPPLILKQSKKFDSCSSTEMASAVDCPSMSVQNEETNVSHGVVGNKPRNDAKSTQNCLDDAKGDHLSKNPSTRIASGKHASSKVLGSKVFQSCTIPEASLRPLVGKVSHIIKRLKINLLDMEAALPEEALRPSKSHIMRRCAWRAFLKSAESIYEMIQATILLEGMIKADYLKNEWWYWSSLTAAAKTCTVSSLALRIYTLDDSIIYIKDKDPQTTPTSIDSSAESWRPTNKTSGKKRKETTDVEPS